MTPADRLNHIITAQKITKTEFAHRLGITKTTSTFGRITAVRKRKKPLRSRGRLQCSSLWNSVKMSSGY